MTYEPTFSGYQLLGDSQLLRFSRKYSTSSSRKSTGDNCFGLCVSGQKIEDLLRRIRENENQISEKLILMIGTNDILQRTDFERMTFFFDRMLLQLIEDGAKHIILMTIPPIPRLKIYDERWETLEIFNELIRIRHNGIDIIVIDAYEKFIEKEQKKIELKPFGVSQRVNYIDSNMGGSVIVPSMKNEFIGKQYSFSDVNTSSFSMNNDSDKFEISLEGYSYVYNPLSDYTCDNDFSDEMESDRINLHYFERYFDRNMKKDLIHLNAHGLEVIKELIIKENYV